MRGATRSNDLARRCDEMTTAYRFANVSGRVHHALSAREARANPLTSSGLKSAHRTRTLKPDGAFPDTHDVEGRRIGHRATQANAAGFRGQREKRLRRKRVDGVGRALN